MKFNSPESGKILQNSNDIISYLKENSTENDFQNLFSELEQISKEENFDATKYLKIFENTFPSVYEKSVGVWEEYSLKEHTLMVMNQFEKYFSDKEISGLEGKDAFRFLLAVHDIGKPLAVEQNEKPKQHEYTIKMVDSLLEKSSFTEKEKIFIETLINQDVIGDYIKLGELNKCTSEILKFAQKNNLEPKEAFEILQIFYLCDAGSYTKDAGGKESLDYLFNFRDKNITFSKDNSKKIQLVEKELTNLNKDNEAQRVNDIFIIAKTEANQIIIKPEDRNFEGKLLAFPNGPESNLSEENWKLVRTPSFKKWFENSNIIDENGEPALVYHTTNYGLNDFEDFSNKRANSIREEKNKKDTDLNLVETGFYFTAGKYEYGKNRLSVFINAKVKEIQKHGDIMNLQNKDYLKFKQQGYDGLVYTFNNSEDEINTLKGEYRKKYAPRTISDKIFFGFNKLKNLNDTLESLFTDKYTKYIAHSDRREIKSKINELRKVQQGAKSPFFEVCVFNSNQIMIVNKEEDFKKLSLNFPQ